MSTRAILTLYLYLPKGVILIREADIQNNIRLALNPYAVIFRANVGKVKTQDGRFFDTGLPPGHPDLYGFRKSDGKVIYLEVKNEKGKLREKQRKFFEGLQDYPVISGVARSAAEAIEIVEKGLNYSDQR